MFQLSPYIMIRDHECSCSWRRHISQFFWRLFIFVVSTHFWDRTCFTMSAMSCSCRWPLSVFWSRWLGFYFSPWVSLLENNFSLRLSFHLRTWAWFSKFSGHLVLSFQVRRRSTWIIILTVASLISLDAWLCKGNLWVIIRSSSSDPSFFLHLRSRANYFWVLTFSWNRSQSSCTPGMFIF